MLRTAVKLKLLIAQDWSDPTRVRDGAFHVAAFSVKRVALTSGERVQGEKDTLTTSYHGTPRSYGVYG